MPVFGSAIYYDRRDGSTTLLLPIYVVDHATPMFGSLCGLVQDRMNEYKIDSKLFMTTDTSSNDGNGDGNDGEKKEPPPRLRAYRIQVQESINK